MFGCDIGMTQSKVAHVDAAGKPVIIPNARGEDITPSALYFPPDGDPLVGTDAREQGVIDPSRFVSNFKLNLGSTTSLVSGASVTPTNATTTLISALKENAERRLSITIEEATFTCPANYFDDAKQALLEAIERAGIKAQPLLSEPAAAGYAYALHEETSRMKILVFDLGGGTFDVSVLEKDGPEISVLTTEGIPKLGGNDLNQCLQERVLDAVEAKCRTRPTPQTEPLFFMELWQRIESAKISLGRQQEVPILASVHNHRLVVKVTQGDFHAMITPLVQQTLDALDRAVAAAGLAMDQVDRLLMVGGTSQLPLIQDTVADHTGLVPRIDIDPERAIAYGAALASLSELSREGKTATFSGQVIPPREEYLREVTAHAVGCCVADTSTPHKRLVNSVIIKKNTPIPHRCIHQFYLESEDQTDARIEILQGEPDADREDCLLIGELVLDNLPTEPTRTQRIRVEYAIDAHGMVTVTVKDTVSGREASVSVDYKKGLTDRDKPAAA